MVGGAGIDVDQAWLSFADEQVVRGATFHLDRGKTCVITGANGSGKSTLLYLCAGLIKADRGRVRLGGMNVAGVNPSELFRKGVRRGFVFQEGGLMSNMNALANVALALRYHADVLRLSVDQIEERARAALDRVRITRNQGYLLPAHLSFGVRKRLALARAIALEPNFFFFDDPDVGLDPDTAKVVHEILCTYRDDPDVTTLVATNRDLLVDRLEVSSFNLEAGKLYEKRGGPAY